MLSRVPGLPDNKLKGRLLDSEFEGTPCQSTRHNMAEHQNLHRHSSMEFKSLISTIILTGRFKFGCKIDLDKFYVHGSVRRQSIL